MKIKYLLPALMILTGSTLHCFAQENEAKDEKPLSEPTFSGLQFRNIGPAFMSGRIADVCLDPENENTWYVAVGSGGVWKTNNAGTTWSPVFEKQKSYSIGCVTVDPNNHHIVWVGTGENVGGRHVGYGDGIYKSEDGGVHWTNMGLKSSQHISKIIVHPKNSDIIYVAAQGPLWSKGGERGFYKSTDGGKNWKKTLGDNEWTGVTDIAIDPRNPDIIYAATWQRARNVASYMGGGPGSGIYRSDDGGETWQKLTEGLPETDMGKIGLAVSPIKPDVIYAAIELDRRSGGIFRSDDLGASWTKMSDVVSGATGPHYYQELYASPHHFDKIYLADVRVQVSEDGGKTFKRMKEQYKHSDNHVIVFKKDDPDWLMVGTDGGLYVSYDDTENWKYFNNLPITQFYKIAIDDSKPFYYIYGGTQDNNTEGGPSRTDTKHGITNADWFVTLYADGHQPATEPGNPDIIYCESQQGDLHRVDRTTGEVIYIKPQPEEGDPRDRFNWDSPILVSPHSPTRLYYASQRVWRSDDRGDSWKPISGDLTKNQDRMNLPIMGKTWGWDAEWDYEAMSDYNTITSLAESPLKEGLIYAGTDDGLIQVTEDGGQTWRKIDLSTLPGAPSSPFVNDIKADLFNENTVYAALDNHKFGDFKPYFYKSADKGKTWQSITSNLPDTTIVWRMVQDFVKPELLFIGTETGIYFTIDGGKQWIKLSGGLPTISFRDLAIQRRENDLIGASFGRGIFILDDYSALRDVSEEQLQQEASLFPVRKAWWYIPRPVISFAERGSKGASFFSAPNPPFGAEFTYYLGKDYKTKKAVRQENEKELKKENKNIKFPGWNEVEKEGREEEPIVILTVRDNDGKVIRRIEDKPGKGFHRTAWDLHYPSSRAIDPDNLNSQHEPKGFMASPGTYSVTLSKKIDGIETQLARPVNFEVEQLHKGALPGSSPDEVAAFWRKIESVQGELSAASLALKNATKKADAMRAAYERTPGAPENLDSALYKLKQNLIGLDEILNGNSAKKEVGEPLPLRIRDRLNVAITGTANSTYGPTATHIKSLDIAKQELESFKVRLKKIRKEQIPAMEKQLIAAGAPWIEGEPIPEK